MRYLGLDLGSRTLGVAISDKMGLIARSLKIIRHNEDYSLLIVEVENLVQEYKIDAIVLGYPKNMNNTIGEKAKLSEDFKEQLEKKIAIPVYLEDERLTTKEANDILLQNDTSRKKRKKVIDSLAATIILQGFLNRKGNISDGRK